MSYEKARKKIGEQASNPAEIAEIAQLVDMHVFSGIHFLDLTKEQRLKILTTQMLIQVKYLPSGLWDRVKGRLVVNGSLQDKTTYDILSSPTVATESVLICLGIAARAAKNCRD